MMMKTQVGVAVLALFAAQALACLGPPYLYVTFHGDSLGAQPAMKYSRDGCKMGVPLSGSLSSLTELRSILIVNEIAYVANAYTAASVILKYGQCNAQGVREYIGSFVTETQNQGLQHPYGLAVDANGDIYVSNQDTDSVLRFYNSSGRPMPKPTSCGVSQQCDYPGTFAEFTTGKGIRGIDFDGKGRLWIAQEDDNAVILVDDEANYIPPMINVNGSPVGVHYSAVTDRVYVSVHGSTDDSVIEVDPVTLKITRTFTNENMQHPAGMVDYEGVLYVVAQDSNSLLAFNITDGALLDTVASGFTDSAEQVTLSSC